MKTKHAHNFKDLTDKIIGRWTVIKFIRYENDKTFWLCKCECGTHKEVSGHSLRKGSTSCGCLQKEKASKANSIHGFSYKNKNSTQEQKNFYQIWCSMKARCLNPHRNVYEDYGGRGIKVCKRWLKFENFRDDMWKSYLKHVEKFGTHNTSLDRWPNVNGDYELANCRWATNHEQNQHTRTYSKTKNHKIHTQWRRILNRALNMLLIRGDSFSKQLKYFGCSSQELRNYIESLFLPGMTWENHGVYRINGPITWHFGHIKGCNQFDLSTEKGRLMCFNHKNLKPQWSRENVRQPKIFENKKILRRGNNTRSKH